MSNFKQLFYAHCGQTSPFPLALEIEKAEGIYLYDSSGKRYMDLISGISVSNLGHCHPNVVEAVQSQSEKFMHLMVYGEYVPQPQVMLSKRLSDILPSSLSVTYLTNSGSEAVEGAIKIARKHSGRSQIVSCKNAYHGSTMGALSVMGDLDYKKNFAPLLPDIINIEFGNIEDLKIISDKTVAIIIEPVQAEAGVQIASFEYWEALKERCEATGTLIIFDEIQTGLGRTGKMFGFENIGIVPDIITLAKGLGGGMPIGAFISSPEIMSSITTKPILGHISTFGGNAVCSSAALACIDTIIEEKLLEEAESKAQLFKDLLSENKKIKEFRQLGMMMAIEFESFEINKKIIDICIEKGVITDWFLFNDKSMRLAPPLIINKEQIKEACKIINNAINEVI